MAALPAGLLVGLAACNATDPLQQWRWDAAASAAAATAFPLRLAGTVFAGATCVGVAKADCDGVCLVTAPCSSGGGNPLWAVHTASASGNATVSVFEVVGTSETGAGSGGSGGSSGSTSRDHVISINGSCLDYEDAVGHLQAFPICTQPAGNQGWELLPGGTQIRAHFLASSPPRCIAVLPKQAPPPPVPPPPRVPVNVTQDRMWRPRYHPVGWGTLSSGHMQDPAAPFQVRGA